MTKFLTPYLVSVLLALASLNAASAQTNRSYVEAVCATGEQIACEQAIWAHVGSGLFAGQRAIMLARTLAWSPKVPSSSVVWLLEGLTERGFSANVLQKAVHQALSAGGQRADLVRSSVQSGAIGSPS